MKPQTLTEAVIRDVLTTWDHVPEAAREWAATYPDRDEAEVEYALQIARDFKAVYGQPGDQLAADLFRLAWRHVNWRRVARALLNRYAPMPRPAALVPMPSAN